MIGTEFSPRLSSESSVNSPDIFRQFQETETKIAIQKDGELTEISRAIIADYFGVVVPERKQSEKKLIAVSEDGNIGYAYVRNKDIGSVVARRMVDFAVIGADRLTEDNIDDKVEDIDSYEDQYTWPLVLAVPEERDITSLPEIRRLATQYPRTAERFFRGRGLSGVEIIPTNGSTELYPYLNSDDEPIDAVIDMRVTGASLAAHNLVEWEVVDQAFPVLIRPREEASA